MDRDVTMIRKWLISLLLLCTALIGASAQEPEVDSLTLQHQLDSLARLDSLVRTVKPKVRESYIDISKYKLQSRYRPESQASSYGSFVSNTFIMAYGTFYKPFVQEYGYGPMVHVGVGKWFTAGGRTHYHGLKLGAGLGYFYDNRNAERIKTADLRVSYMMDLTSYVAGYNPQRFFSVSPIAGFGVSISEGSGSLLGKMGVTAHLGADIATRVLPGLELVVEPLFELQQNKRDIQMSGMWGSFMPVFQGSVGVHVSLDRKVGSTDPGRDWRVSAGVGAALLDTYMMKKLSDLPSLLGVSYTVGIGRKFTDYFDWRFQIGYSKSYWSEGEIQGTYRKLSSQYIFGRLDAMLDILAFFKKDSRFSIYAMAGPEAGLIAKEGTMMNQRPYVGASGGIQLKSRLFHNISAYLEGRMSIVPYSYLSNVSKPVNRNYYDNVSWLGLGLEYKFADRRGEYYGMTVDDVYAWAHGSFYRPDAFTQAVSSGPAATVGVGIWLKSKRPTLSRHGLRLGAGAGIYQSNAVGYMYRMIHGSLAYMFDLSPHIFGEHSGLLGLYPLLEVDVARTWSRVSSACFSFAPFLGAGFSTAVLPRTDIVVEPAFGIEPLTWKGIVRANVGVNVHLGKKGKREQDPGEDWRISAGINYGLGLHLGVARRYFGFFDWRVQAAFALNALTPDKAIQKSKAVIVRLDAMPDLVRVFGNDSGSFAVSPFAGPEVGVLLRGKSMTPYVGASAGVQAKMRVGPRLGVYFEPRVSVVPHTVYEPHDGYKYKNVGYPTYSFSVGVEYAL